jgi:hypothetical protein
MSRSKCDLYVTPMNFYRKFWFELRLNECQVYTRMPETAILEEELVMTQVGQAKPSHSIGTQATSCCKLRRVQSSSFEVVTRKHHIVVRVPSNCRH